MAINRLRVRMLLWAWVVASLSGLVAACGGLGGNTLRVSDSNLDAEVQSQQNLVFNFNRDLARPEQLGRWDSTQYVRFEPPVVGRFRWLAPNQLVFSPEAGFRPGTHYKAQLAPSLLNNLAGTPEGGGISIADDEALAFSTPFLRIQEARAYWATPRTTGPRADARVRISLNFKASAAEMRSHITIKRDNQVVAFDVLEAEDGQVFTLSAPFQTLDEDHAPELEITLLRGAKCTECTGGTPEPEVLEVALPRLGDMAVANVETEHNGTEGTIHVYFTQPVQSRDFNNFIKCDPEVAFTATSEGNALRITGPFAQDQAYELNIAEGLRGVFDVPLQRKHEQYVRFGKPVQSVGFVHNKGLYLSERGSQDIAVRILNVPKVKVKITKVFENNLVHFLRQSQGYGGHWDEFASEYHSYRYWDTEHYGELVYEQSLNPATLPGANGAQLLSLRFPDRYRDQQGIYVVDIISEENYWQRASKIISITDLGLVTRLGPDELWVSANSIRSTDALAGVKINVISHSNLRLQTATTDANGVAVIRGLKGLTGTLRPAIITVTKQDGTVSDFNYLAFDQARVETSRFDVGGRSTREQAYDAFLYAERPLYRPGETAHLNTVIRTWDWQVVPEMPVLVKVMLPTGRVFQTLRGRLNGHGAFAFDVPFPETTPTGTYNIDLYTGADELLTSYRLQVEEFMPDRLRVKLRMEAEQVVGLKPIGVNIAATNLFGPPARGRSYELKLQLHRKAFAPANYRNYDFEVSGLLTSTGDGAVMDGATDEYAENGAEADAPQLGEFHRVGRLNEQGQVAERFTLPETYRNTGLLRVQAFATVFDETGRPVHRVAEAEVFTQNVFFGIRRFGRYLSTRQPLSIPLVALNAQGQPLSTQARVQVVKMNWETVLERNGESFRYVSKKREQVMSERSLGVLANGETVYGFTPTLSGEYEIRLMAPGARTYVARTFYAYGLGATDNMAFEVDNEGQIDITTDRTAYEAGQQARVLFSTPFEGKLLVTVERDRVLEHHVLKTDHNAAELLLSLPQGHVPNVYVSATLIRPLLNSGSPFTVAHGFANLTVERANNRLPLAIAAPTESRSQRQQTIALATEPGAEVTLAVVDEGILQLLDAPNPDPYKHFYGKRALETLPADLFRLLLPELGNTLASSTGGDAMHMNRNRPNPFTNRRLKLVSHWSGQKRADATGNVSVTLDIPEFSGELRVVAVAYKNNRFASAAHAITVKDPVVLSAALPRFLVPGDTLTMPVTISNTTNRAANFTGKVRVSGPMTVLSETGATGSVPADGEARMVFRLAAKPDVAEAQIHVQVEALGERFSTTTDILVRPSHALESQNGAGQATGETTVQVGPTDYLPQTARGSLVVSRSPVVGISNHLRSLVGYPHGCLEQVVSSAFAQLYYHEISRMAGHTEMAGGNPAHNVQEAIRKVEALQNYSGGFAYWPGQWEGNTWASVYAVHFLHEAKRAGFEVQEDVLRNGLKYARRAAQEREEHFLVLATGNRLRITPKEVIYSLFVLAVAGQRDISTMNYYRARTESLSPDARYMLAAAFALGGDRMAFNQLLPGSFDQHRLSATELSGSFSSPVRDLAIALYAVLEASPDHSQVPMLARMLGSQLQHNQWLNTQENAWAFLALGRLAHRDGPGNATATVSVEGRTLGTLNGNQPLVIKEGVVGKQVKINAQGGNLYYFWEAEGISRSGRIVEEDRNLRVRRTLLDANGNVIAGRRFRQNDLVIVKLTVSADRNAVVPNVVLTDLLPAGFEVENPRISRLPRMAWLKPEDQSRPAYYDIRDDRVYLYTDVSAATQTFYYQMRAVSPGTFKAGPALADAMYDAVYRSAHGAGTVQIVPWEDMERN